MIASLRAGAFGFVLLPFSATNTLVLGVIGPGVTIAAGNLGGLPAWAIVLICALQILCAVAIRHRSP